MKFSLAWHRTALFGMTVHCRQNRKYAEETLARCAESETRQKFYAAQIAEAERRKWSAFDRDRLLLKKKKKEYGNSSSSAHNCALSVDNIA